MTAALNREMSLCCYLLPRENRGYTKCCFLLSLGKRCQSGINFLIENFTEAPIMNFIPDLVSKTVNKSGLPTN